MQKSENTKKFYDDLSEGKVVRNLWGRANRFSPDLIATKRSVSKYFTSVLSGYLSKNDTVLDFGCGPGSFLSILSPFCNRVIGVDITPNFIEECKKVITRNSLSNTSALLVTPGTLPFEDDCFDSIVLVDTIHHLENIIQTFDELCRVLKEGGKLLIFEPNKLNPALYIMCCLDKNERGLLKLGTRQKYRQLLAKKFRVIADEYNGLLIGPKGSLALFLADTLACPILRPVLGWLSPKIFIAAIKK